MNHYQLTIDDLHPISFKASNSELKYRLHSAFIELTKTHGKNRAILYVHHHSQGWRQVFNDSNQYVIINNPLTLDYEALIFAVINTLAQCDSWPTEKERYQMREKRLAEERNLNAEIRRSSFRILTSNRDKSGHQET